MASLLHSLAPFSSNFRVTIADQFDPLRFIDERHHRITKNPWIFLPFNAGPRICLGQQFAYNEMSFIIIRLLQAFEGFELDESMGGKFCPKLTLTFYAGVRRILDWFLCK